ncbi:hypothetical protein K501DRAFT_173051 [Backusella circina FSU 941]|nr:hypothetical protein K501DRAFT_173051 [Backusella circina FSU 941]
MRPTASGQIDTYAGNTIVLICNLDPAATAEDIGETCSQFGPIVSCDILLDQHGRPLSKAEIEFVYHTSAQECVTKLDNQIADGRVLRAFLKSKATPPAAPRYSSRTVMSNPQGSEYNSPQLSVRYDQNRMPQGNMHSRHYSHYPSQY